MNVLTAASMRQQRRFSGIHDRAPGRRRHLGSLEDGDRNIPCFKTVSAQEGYNTAVGDEGDSAPSLSRIPKRSRQS